MKSKYILPFLILTGIFAGGIAIKCNYDNSTDKSLSSSKLSVEEYSTYTYLSSEIQEKAEKSIAFAEFENEYTPEYMLELSDAVAIVSIISVDSADTMYNQAVGYTYGTMVVNNTIYGNLGQGSVINYMKSGGTMTLEEYDRYQIEEIKEKHSRLRNQAGIDASQVYVNMHFENDPEIEAGKTYLCYLKYIDSIGKYEIIGLGNGFRELNISSSNTVSAYSINPTNYTILNNNTGEYESLNDYINRYIDVE